MDVFPFALKGEDIHILLLKRSEDEEYPNVWQGVSGHIQKNETAYDAGIRELKEETGFIPEATYVLEHISSYYLKQTDKIVHVPGFACQVKLSPPTLSTEHSNYRWCTFDEALKLVTWQNYRKALLSLKQTLSSETIKQIVKI